MVLVFSFWSALHPELGLAIDTIIPLFGDVNQGKYFGSGISHTLLYGIRRPPLTELCITMRKSTCWPEMAAVGESGKGKQKYFRYVHTPVPLTYTGRVEIGEVREHHISYMPPVLGPCKAKYD